MCSASFSRSSRVGCVVVAYKFSRAAVCHLAKRLRVRLYSAANGSEAREDVRERGCGVEDMMVGVEGGGFDEETTVTTKQTRARAATDACVAVAKVFPDSFVGINFRKHI